MDKQFHHHKTFGQELSRGLMYALEMMEAILRRFGHCHHHYYSEVEGEYRLLVLDLIDRLVCIIHKIAQSGHDFATNLLLDIFKMISDLAEVFEGMQMISFNFPIVKEGYPSPLWLISKGPSI